MNPYELEQKRRESKPSNKLQQKYTKNNPSYKLWWGGTAFAVLVMIGIISTSNSGSNDTTANKFTKVSIEELAKVDSETTNQAKTAIEETSNETSTNISEEEAQELAFNLLLEEKFPLIALVSNQEGNKELIYTVTDAICEIKRTSTSDDQFSSALLFMWSDFDDNTKLLFENDPLKLSEFSGMSIGWKCPELLE